jgi:alkyl hydroperoxide reductase subunit AhpF
VAKRRFHHSPFPIRVLISVAVDALNVKSGAIVNSELVFIAAFAEPQTQQNTDPEAAGALSTDSHMTSFECIVIGSGNAGCSAAFAAAEAGCDKGV